MKKVRIGLVVLSMRNEEMSMFEVADCCPAESENMYFDKNLNPTFASDDNAGSSG
jgi:hypothetical protein